MKMAASALRTRLERSGPEAGGYLIYSREEALVRRWRDIVAGQITGPNAAAELRIEYLEGTAVANHPDTLINALTSAGFFEGERVVVVEGAGDRIVPVISETIPELGKTVARLVVTAGYLRPNSKLRKLFESSKNLVATAIFDNPATTGEVRAMLQHAGIIKISEETLQGLTARLALRDPATAPGTIEMLALYKLGDVDAISDRDLDACMPSTIAAATDKLLDAIADRQAQRVGPAFRALDDRDRNPVMLCIMAMRMFRKILIAAAHPSGPEAGIAAVSPPVFGPQRNRLIRHANLWGVQGARFALRELTNADLVIRGAITVPQISLMERTFLRIACWKKPA